MLLYLASVLQDFYQFNKSLVLRDQLSNFTIVRFLHQLYSLFVKNLHFRFFFYTVIICLLINNLGILSNLASALTFATQTWFVACCGPMKTFELSEIFVKLVSCHHRTSWPQQLSTFFLAVVSISRTHSVWQCFVEIVWRISKRLSRLSDLNGW